VEHFEDDDDNDNDSDDVEDVSVHGSWITRRYPGRQAISSARKRLALQLLVASTESYLPGRGADFEQVF